MMVPDDFDCDEIDNTVRVETYSPESMPIAVDIVISMTVDSQSK